MRCILTDHTTDETHESEVTDPANALTWIFDWCLLSYAPTAAEALVTRVQVVKLRHIDGWQIVIESVYDDCMQRYTARIKE